MQIVNLKVPGEVHVNSASRQWARRYHEVYPGALSSWGYMHPYSSLDGRLITGLSPAFNSLVPIYTPGWRETPRVVSRLRTARTVTQDRSIQSPVR